MKRSKWQLKAFPTEIKINNRKSKNNKVKREREIVENLYIFSKYKIFFPFFRFN